MKKRSRGLKAAALALCASLSLSALPGFPVSADDSDYYLRGDPYNNDGVTAMDAQMIQRKLVQLITFDELQNLQADANADGNVDISDAVTILQWVVKRTNYFHAGEYVSKETGKGAVIGENLSAADGSNIYKVEVPQDGNYKLRLRAHSDTGGDYKVIVNDANVYTPLSVLPYSEMPHDNFENEITDESIVVVALKAGSNTIVIEGDKPLYIEPESDIFRTVAKLDPTLPYECPVTTTTTAETTTTAPPTTTTTTTTTTPAQTLYYAVDAKTYDGWEESSNAGFKGKSYFNYNNSIGGFVDWTVTVPEDGNYAVTFRYANGTNSERTCKIMVNGEHNECIYRNFSNTGSWTDWKEETVVLALKAGENTIKARATTTDGGPNMDYIEVTRTDSAPTAMVKATDGIGVENLNRGVSAAFAGSGVLVSWRHLATDNDNTTFNLWRITKTDERTMLGTFTMQQASCYFDKDGTNSDIYTIDTYVNGECTEFANLSVNLTNKNSGVSGAYFDIPTQTPPSGTTPTGETYTYTENDCSVGDVDGDGQYEIFVKWDPSNSKDNSSAKEGSYTGEVYIDCYKLDGTMLWRVNLGKNIRAGAHYTQFMVADFDNDGKAEMICKTADGTIDGTGSTIGDASADYRTSAGTVLSGPEYITLFDGATGKALDTQNYTPSRGEQDSSTWGDAYGNRSERYTACVAYLDGTTPSAVFGRGYYTRLAVSAWDVKDKKLSQRWIFDTGFNKSAAGYGDGNHQELAADVDGDGKQEIVCGSAVIDDNGKLLYTTGMAHGDAMHIGDFDPSNPGLEIFQCLEDASHPNGTEVGYGVVLRDAKTGKVLFRETASGDTGRCLADNLIGGNDGAEMVGSHSGNVYSASGKHATVCQWSDITKWGQNSVVYWSDTLERAVLDRTMADQYGKGRIFTGDGVSYNNYTKSNACLTVDLFGDWREEMIFRKSDGGLRVFSTTFETQFAMPTLMQNPQYRVQVAAQNNGYNQPPHTDFFLDSAKAIPEPHEVHKAAD